MSNVLPPETVEAIRRSFGEGQGIRATSRLLGVSDTTVARYYRMGPEQDCPCGRPLRHQGWCRFRLQRSPARQRVLQRMHWSQVVNRRPVGPASLTVADATARLAELLKRIEAARDELGAAVIQLDDFLSQVSPPVAALARALLDEIRRQERADAEDMIARGLAKPRPEAVALIDGLADVTPPAPAAAARVPAPTPAPAPDPRDPKLQTDVLAMLSRGVPLPEARKRSGLDEAGFAVLREALRLRKAESGPPAKAAPEPSPPVDTRAEIERIRRMANPNGAVP